ncbi:MAG: ABC-2 transporter permease [Clostridia bacterium]
MKGLLLKDFFVITKQLKLFLIVIPVMSLFGGGSMAGLAILMGSVLPMTAIAYDERSKWNEMAVMMPYSKQSLVLSKYLLGYICMLGAAVLVLLGHSIAAMVGFQSMQGNMTLLLMHLSMGMIFIAINTPILFRFGSEKGRFVFIIAMGLVAASSTFLKGTGNAVLRSLTDALPLLLFAGAVVLNLLSMVLSVRMKGREW